MGKHLLCLLLTLTAAIHLAGCDAPPAKPDPAAMAIYTPSPDSQQQIFPSKSPVDPSLKTEGYRYYGLDAHDALPMIETIGDTVLTGGAVTRIVSATKDKAIFDLGWTGELSSHADSQVEATKDGVFAISLYGQTLPQPQMDIPADPKPGATWTYVANVKGPNGEDIQEQGSDKIVGLEKLQIGKKTYDSLRIDEQGTSRVDQTQYTDTAKRWLVKGLGTVKLETDSTSSKGTQHQLIVADLQ
jgi:hypothetical protein